MDALLTTSEVAENLDVDETTVRLWCRQGKFPNAKQFGGSWIIPKQDLDRFEKPKMGRPVTKKASKKGSKK